MTGHFERDRERAVDPAPGATTVCLADLRIGDHARLVAGTGEDHATLSALGLTTTARFRVARVGDPWIVQVRATRIGLSDEVARGLHVVPEP